MKRLRIYVDTSVFGGCRDEEFREESEALLAMTRTGSVTLLISPVLAAELRRAPPEVQGAFDALPLEGLEELPLSQEAEALRDAYLAAGVVGAASTADAHHVALATVARADMIVSWNFRHIVHYDKIRGFNTVNVQAGYPPIAIHSPKEVV
jgi:PIN domain